jgi:cation diffusion facilitator CzcD-associated flavoprotein CzcO
MISEHVDVLIIGAGLSGIGAARHLQLRCPGKTYTILEARDAIGGTWDLFRYPGVRSDSDMYTLGYAFKPWEDAKAIADGPSILEYVRSTARDHGIDDHIRFGHRVVRAAWSSADARWEVEAHDAATGTTTRLTASFLFSCTGYYRYDEGYTPPLPGVERFAGPVVHPQHWPEDLDHAGRRVVVIGSGATAVTLVPAMAQTAAHVTMLQRSPSYVLALPGRDPLADALRRRLPARVAYPIVRWKNVLLTGGFYQLSRRAPKVAKALIRRGVERGLGGRHPLEPHFVPAYEPWDQRLCLVPDGDLFRALRDGSASVVTDTIETFTETGLRLTSGAELEADVIVTATGLNLLALGGMQLTVDGREVRLPETLGYKGMMLSDVPNFAIAIGYTNASWTLKSDLTCQYVCRLLHHMDAHGYVACTPRNHDPDLPTRPFIDLTSGYVQRSVAEFPRQGPRTPWRLFQNYPRDVVLLRYGSLDDGAMEFTRASAARAPEAPTAFRPVASSGAAT